MKRIAAVFLLAFSFAAGRVRSCPRRRPLAPHQSPTSKSLTLPVPGYLARTNSFPGDHCAQSRWPLCRAAQPGIRHAGDRRAPVDRHPRSQQQSTARFSRPSPERRLFHAPKLFHRARVFERRQTPVRLDSSITDPTGEKPTSTGNGIAIYRFAAGQVIPDRSSRSRRRAGRRERSCLRPTQNSRRDRAAISRGIRRVAYRHGRPLAHRR